MLKAAGMTSDKLTVAKQGFKTVKVIPDARKTIQLYIAENVFCVVILAPDYLQKLDEVTYDFRRRQLKFDKKCVTMGITAVQRSGEARTKGIHDILILWGLRSRSDAHLYN